MKNNRSFIGMLPFVFIVATLFTLFSTTAWTKTATTLDYNQLMSTLKTEEIAEVGVSVGANVTTVTGEYTADDGTVAYFVSTIPSQSEQVTTVLNYLDEAEVLVRDAEETSVWMQLLPTLLQILIFVGFGMLLFGQFNGANRKAADTTRSRAKLQGDTKVRFKDVAGCDEEKEEMKELIEYLRHPKKFAAMGARIPKGILMVGPPGTGKTLLAKAVAGEANVPFYSVAGSDFAELYVGVGASRVRDMFKKAKQTAPCMIFIDEMDAVARQRGAGIGGGSDEKEQTLNQLLIEMDGIDGNSGVIVIAATNRPDVLDPALLRPGRIDRQITVGLPDRKGRTEILQVHARNKKLAEDVDLTALAKRTPGFSGADLENVLNEAAILAVREEQSIITMKHLDEAIDRVMMGPAKKSKKYDEASKKLVAYHEAGHAIVGLYLEGNSTKVQKITIIPRGQAGGYNLMSEKEEKLMPTKKDFMAKITSYMGGRVAEEIFFDDISAGAVGDIESSTRIARDMVTLYGMSDLGPIKYDSGNQSVFLGRDYNSPLNVSGQIAFEIDKEVRKIIDACHDKAHEVISAHREMLIKIANILLEYETITEEEIEAIAEGKRTIEDIMKPHTTVVPVEEITSEEVVTEEVNKEKD
ncbi:MAG: ATP-dependent zinc metalloprotease FtsH [Anaerorhabdus sp.]